MRFAGLGSPSFTSDETYDYRDSLRFCAQPDLRQPVSDGYLNGQLPFVAACGLYRLAGDGEHVARALSALAGVFSVAAAYLLGRRLFGERWGLLTGLLLAVSPFAVASSRLGFSHGHGFQVPFVLFAVLAALSTRAGKRDSAPWRSGIAGLLLGLALGSDLLAGFWAVSVLALLLVRLRTAGRKTLVGALLAFAGGFGLGLFSASPMYAFEPRASLADIRERIRFWDASTEFLWLGREVTELPLYYYAVVMLVKIGPPVVVLAGLAVVQALGPAREHAGARRTRALLLAFWPLLYFSLKPFKSPFYVAALLPVAYLLAVDGLQRAMRWTALRTRPWWKALMVVLVLAAEALPGAYVHPDYLMSGIHYGDRVYGDFQGPAVSHGQWIGEALGLIRADTLGSDPVVVVPNGYVPAQAEHYARRYGLGRVHTAKILSGVQSHREEVLASVQYAVINQDCLRHQRGRRVNRLLLRVREDPSFSLVATFRSGHLPMVWVYRRR